MIDRTYRIYYQYLGPTRSDPFDEPKTQQQIEEALNRFLEELEPSFDEEQGFDAEMVRGVSENERIVRFKVNAESQEFETALIRILNSNGLFGELMK
jgi:hypothetical protein